MDANTLSTEDLIQLTGMRMKRVAISGADITYRLEATQDALNFLTIVEARLDQQRSREMMVKRIRDFRGQAVSFDQFRAMVHDGTDPTVFGLVDPESLTHQTEEPQPVL